jgi:hypothetical protein
MVFGWISVLVSGALMLLGVCMVFLLPIFGIHGATLNEGFPIALCVFIGSLALIVCCGMARALFDISDKLQSRN